MKYIIIDNKRVFNNLLKEIERMNMLKILIHKNQHEVNLHPMSYGLRDTKNLLPNLSIQK